jgi:hypothetical protein
VTDVRHLAQYNVARLRDPLDERVWREFLDGLDRINRLAERSPGFVWRLAAPEGHLVDGGGMFANLSVWESYEGLHRFLYRSGHGDYTRRRRRWFDPIDAPTTVLWWVDAGVRPSLDEATARLDHLRGHGPSPRAFSLLRQFDGDGRPRTTAPSPVGSRQSTRISSRWPMG